MKIVFDRADGFLSVTTPFIGADINTERDKILQEDNTLTFKGTTSESDLPNVGAVVEDYALINDVIVKTPVTNPIVHFQDAWVWDDVNNKIVEDSTKVKTIRAQTARDLRNELLALTDSDEFRLIDQALSDIRNYRQTLRDLGTSIDSDPENIPWPTKPVN